MIEDELTTDKERLKELDDLLEAIRPFADLAYQNTVWLGKVDGRVDSFQECLYELLGDSPDRDRLGEFLSYSLPRLGLPNSLSDELQKFHYAANPYLLSFDLTGIPENDALGDPNWPAFVTKATTALKTCTQILSDIHGRKQERTSERHS